MSRLTTWSADATTQSGTVSRTVTPSVEADDVVERLEMLDVDRGDHVDALVEQLHDVFPAFPMPRARARCVCASSSTIATSGCRRDHRVDVHLLERHAAVLDLLARHDLEVADLRLGLGAPVRLDESDDDIDASTSQIVRLVEHAVRLARSRRRADVELELPALALSNEREEFGRLCARLAGAPTTLDGGASQIRLTPRERFSQMATIRRRQPWVRLKLHQQREVQASFGLSEIREEIIHDRSRQPCISANRRDAAGTGEVRHVRCAVIELEAERRVLIRHVVERHRRVPCLELRPRVPA